MLIRSTARLTPPRPPPVIEAPATAAPVRAPSASAIPDVKAIIASTADPLVRNERFNAAYQQLALGIQDAIDPGAVFRGPSAQVYPNWFAVGAHASPQVGRSIMAADRTLRALNLLRGQPHLHTRTDVFDALQLDPPSRKVAGAVAGALEKLGAGPSDATAVAAAVSLMCAADRATSMQNTLLDPRQAVAVGYRLWELLHPPGKGLLSTAWDALKGLFGNNQDARDSQVLERVLTMARTYKNLLADGNKAIFSDIGGSAEQYLRLRQKLGQGATPDAVLRQLALPESSEAGAREVFDFALAHAHDRRPPTRFDAFHGNDVVRAAFAVYEVAARTADPKRKNELVSFANNLVAWREQHDAVNGAFWGTRAGELPRDQVISAVTPLVEIDVGGRKWSYDAYARARGDTDGNPLTAPATEGNWARFDDRWPGILDAFRFAYQDPKAVWRFPDPRVRRTG